jgi:hypothetical protein
VFRERVGVHSGSTVGVQGVGVQEAGANYHTKKVPDA